jgi:tRNA threonylcarbamoyladenosine biosynthesis protein TsaB
MKILSLDTATEACSAALYIDGEVTTQYQLAPREHSRLILRMIADLVADAGLDVSQLDAIAFGRGPGSFMGLRIAAGIAQGIAFAHDTPLVPISTLEAIAQVAHDRYQVNHVLAAIDARMDEVYWAAYRLEHGRWLLQDEEQVISPDQLTAPEAGYSAQWLAAGTGWASYGDRITAAINYTPGQIESECFPSAEAIAKLAVLRVEAGETVRPAAAVPVYLRNDVAKKPKPVVL